MYSVTSKWPHQDSIKVEWNLGKRCNLDCAYCPAEIHDNFSPHTNVKVIHDTIDALYELDKPVRVSFTGGEPTVHPQINEIIEHARQRLAWVNITTNGLRHHEWYAKQLINHWVFSLHFDNKHWERAIQNVLLFTQENEIRDNIPFQVNVMAHHEYMDRVRSACNTFDGHNVPYVIRRIRWTKADDRDYFDDMRYKEKDLEWILSKPAKVMANTVIDDKDYMHANDIIKHKLNQFEGWSCSAGIESLMINWDGEVHRATCRVGGSLGNIYDGSFEAPEEWVTCTRKWCTCAADIPLTKVKQ